MAWARTGTVSFTNGSTVVTGVGTQFLVELRQGDGIRGPDGLLYEAANLVSNTQLTLGQPYAGATIANRPLWVVATQGYLQKTGDDLRAWTNTAGVLVDSEAINALASLNGSAGAVPYFTSVDEMATAPSTVFGRSLWNVANAAAGRTALQLGTAATSNVQTSVTDTTAGRLQIAGSFGWAGPAIPLNAVAFTAVRQSGHYYMVNGTDGPPGVSASGTLFVNTSDSAGLEMDLTFYPYNEPWSIWRRKKLSTWGGWYNAGSIGVGQTWRDVTSSRALGTDYTNTTGRPIMVQVWGGPASVDNTTYICRVNGVAICRATYVTAGRYLSTTSFIVQPGLTYSITAANGTAPLMQWCELTT